MDYMIDNPMTFGDYPGADDPDITMECPCCHRVWNGYTMDGETIWEFEDCEMDDDPVQNGMCPICAWQNRTHKNEMEYIERHAMQKDVLEYWMDANRIDRDSADELWKMMVEHERDFLDELIDDYIEDGCQVDFVDWMLDGGANGRT